MAWTHPRRGSPDGAGSLIRATHPEVQRTLEYEHVPTMEAPSTYTVSNALADLQSELRARYGDRLARTVLFGSYARGETRPDSDAGILVMLWGPLDTYEEIKQLVPVAMGLWERYGLDVHLTPFSAGGTRTAVTPSS